MQRFPQCLFKPGDKPMAGLLLSSIMVRNDEELAAALADGWFESPEAADASRQSTADQAVEVVSRREVLENKARAMGIKFDGRTSDRKLAELIAAKTSEQAAA